jgi:predicted metalloprotease with PDZ domain
VIEASQRAAFTDGATSADPQNQGNTDISYYTSGESLALGIDLSIRTRFPGKSLDDWMRSMWRLHPDVEKPYTLEDLELALAEATGSKEFAGEIFRRHVRGREPMDYEALLARAGLLLRPRTPGRAWIGFPAMTFFDRGSEITVSTLRGSPLYEAGLDRGDRLVEADGKSLKTRGDLDDLAAAHKPGDRTVFLAETRAGRKQVELTWIQAPDLEVVR